MILKVYECEGLSGAGALMRDLVAFPRVDLLVEAVLSNRTDYVPLDFAVGYNGNTYMLRSAGQNKPDAKRHLNAVKRFGVRRCKIPSDIVNITADIFEQELTIVLSG